MTDKLSLEAISLSPPGARFSEPLILRASPLIVSESSSEDSSCTSGDSCAASLPSQAEVDYIRLSDDKQVREESPSPDQEFEAPPLPADDEQIDGRDTESALEPAQPMQEGGSRKRIPTQRLKSSQLLQSSRVPNEGDDDELPPLRFTPKKNKVKTGSKDSSAVQSIEDIQPGDMMEMFQSAKTWFRIRVADVKDKRVRVRGTKQFKPADDQDSSSSPGEGWWVEFKKGLFRRLQGESRTTKEVQRKKSSAPKAAPVATKPTKSDGETRRKPTSGEAESAPSKSKATSSSKSKEAVMKQAMKIRKPTKESKDKDKKGKTKSGSKESPPKNSSKQAPSKRLSKGSQDGEPSAAAGGTSNTEGESSAAAVVTGNQRRDWGLMHVDVVGRNRPPFARTLLFHGPIQVRTPLTACRRTCSTFVACLCSRFHFFKFAVHIFKKKTF
jgi:hypothetical protein